MDQDVDTSQVFTKVHPKGPCILWVGHWVLQLWVLRALICHSLLQFACYLTASLFCKLRNKQAPKSQFASAVIASVWNSHNANCPPPKRFTPTIRQCLSHSACSRQLRSWIVTSFTQLNGRKWRELHGWTHIERMSGTLLNKARHFLWPCSWPWGCLSKGEI